MNEEQLLTAAEELCRLRGRDLSRECILAATEIQNYLDMMKSIEFGMKVE